MDRFFAGIQRMDPPKNQARMCIRDFSRRFRERFHLSFGKIHPEQDPTPVMGQVRCRRRNELMNLGSRKAQNLLPRAK